MTSPQRRKGTGFELEVVNFLRTHGHREAERAYGAGRPDDRGDIVGIEGWCLELKNHKEMDLAGWVTEAAAEARNARCPWWAVIAKRRNRAVAEAYVVMTLEQFARLLAGESCPEPGCTSYRGHGGMCYDGPRRWNKGEVRGPAA